jgi:hypothetical protein
VMLLKDLITNIRAICRTRTLLSGAGQMGSSIGELIMCSCGLVAPQSAAVALKAASLGIDVFSAVHTNHRNMHTDL